MSEKLEKYKGLKLLFKYLLKFKVKTAISIGLLVVAKMVSVADPYVLKLLIDLFSGPNSHQDTTPGDKISRTVSKMDEKVFFDSNPHQRVVV